MWIPWARGRFYFTPEEEKQLQAISPATIDRRLKPKKRILKRRIYGSTRPGTLLKHHIPIKTTLDIHTPGFLEVDLVSHSGSSAQGEFIYTIDCTDIHTGWSELRAVMGKGQVRFLEAFKEIKQELPFPLKGIDSDNDSANIFYHLKEHFCDRENIQFTRGKPYKKDDNAHIEQKNWTHIRVRIFAYIRYESKETLEAMNDLYRNKLRWFQNFFQPSVKMIEKVQISSKIKKIYDPPRTPLQRVLGCKRIDHERASQLITLFRSLDPFELSETIDKKLDKIYRLATQTPRVQRIPRERPFNEPERLPTSIAYG